MTSLNRFLFLFLAILVSGIAVSEAVFRMMALIASGFSGPAQAIALGVGGVIGVLIGLPGLWISIRRGASLAVWGFMGVLLLFPILGAFLPQ